MSQRCIYTEAGLLKAHVRGNPAYPGIDIRLERSEGEIPLAWVEVDRTQPQPVLKMRLYGDCKADDPTESRAITLEELNAYFASLVNGAVEFL